MRTKDKSHRLGRPRPLRQWLTAEDYAAAIDAACVPLILQPDHIPALSAAERAIDQTLRALQRPEPISLLTVADDLRAIGKRGRPALRRLLPELPAALAAANPRAAVADLLTHSDVTAIIALLDAASSDAGSERGAAVLADAIVKPSNLRPWAQAAERQYAAAATSRVPGAAVADPVPDSGCLGRSVGFCLIATYVALSGRRAGASRVDGRYEHEGTPTGPLIRYLVELYSRLHAHLAADGFTRHLAGERLWSPTPETLVPWIDDYRRDEARPPT